MLDDVSDQSAGSLDEGELLGETGLEQHSDAVVAGHVGGGNQRHVLTDTQMSQVVGLSQYVELLGDRRIDLGQFLAEVFSEHFHQASVRLHRLLADKLEALVEL